MYSLRLAAAFLFISLVLLGCSNKKADESGEHSVKATGFAEAIGQDRFLVHVSTIQQYDDVLYLSGQGYHHIFALNHNLEIVRAIGQSGEGPGEFSSWPDTFQITGNRIYGYDPSSKNIQVFTLEGEFIRSIPLDPQYSFWNQGLSVDRQGYIYIASFSPENDFAITKFDSTGKVINAFGGLLKTSYTEVQNRRMSARRIVLVGEEYLLAVGNHVPVIEKYSLEGELLQMSDLSDSPYFTERISYAEENNFSQGRSVIALVVSSIGMFNNRLYIIPIEGSPVKRNLRVNRLLELDVESLDIENAYTLLDNQGDPLRWVEAFGFVSENELIAFHYTDGILYRYRNTILAQ